MSKLTAYLSAIRTYQWYKSFWVIFPLVELGGREFAEVSWLKVLLGILLVTILSSIVYVVNDLNDVERDQLHPTKKNRPFASGALTKKDGVLLVAILLIVIIALGLWINIATVWFLSAIYLLGNLGYTRLTKYIPYVEFITYGLLFPIRTMIGTAIFGGMYFTPAYWFVVSLGVTGLIFFRLFEKKWTDGSGRAVLAQYNTKTLAVLFAFAVGLQVISHATLLSSLRVTTIPATVAFAAYWGMLGRHAFLKPTRTVNMDDMGEIIKNDLLGTAVAIAYVIVVLFTFIL